MISKGGANPGEFLCEGVVVLGPSPAVDVTVRQSGDGTPDATLHVVRKDGTTWADSGSGLAETTDPAAGAAADYLLPAALFGAADNSYVARMTTVREEQQNGIAAVHLVASPELVEENGAGQQFGLRDATWTWDVWVAKEGGYIVRYELLGSTLAGATASLVVDLTEINSAANVVSRP